MNDKILTLLSFATKAGKLSFGMDAAISAVRSGKSELVVVSGTVSPKSQKEITFHSNQFNVRVCVLEQYSIETISGAVGRKCGIISVNDSSFAGAIINAADSGRKC